MKFEAIRPFVQDRMFVSIRPMGLAPESEYLLTSTRESLELRHDNDVWSRNSDSLVRKAL